MFSTIAGLVIVIVVFVLVFRIAGPSTTSRTISSKNEEPAAWHQGFHHYDSDGGGDGGGE